MNEQTKPNEAMITDPATVEALLQDAKQARIPQAEAIARMRQTIHALEKQETQAQELRKAVEAQFLSVSAASEASYDNRGKQ